MRRGTFSLDHNVPAAVRQEYELARKHMGEVRAFLDDSRDDHAERYLDAQDRLNRARELTLRG